jgi:hypothetical protein
MVPVCVCVGSYRCFIVPGTGYVKERAQKDVCVCVWRDCVVKVEGNRSARGCIAPQWVDAVGGCIDYRRRCMSCMYMYEL